MKKFFIQTIVLAFALSITAGAFAQAPTSTRQRRTAVESTQPAVINQPATSNPIAPSDKPVVATPSPSPAPADNAPTGRQETADEAEIVQNYNNFFTTYKLGPEDVISVTVFGQDRYSRQGIKIPPSGRISLALIPDGIFVSGKTVDQVSELIKKRYDEYIREPQVSVSLDQAGSYRYSVIGDVGTPGIRLMTRRLSVTEALAEAG